MATGSRVFEYWDPTATNVWLVFKNNGISFPMQKGLEPGHWKLLSSDVPAGDAYAFVSEWVQELRHCGELSWFGAPHPEAKEVGLVPMDLPSPEMWSPPKKPKAEVPADPAVPTSKGGYCPSEDASTEEVASQSELTDAERLAASEFFVQATDNGYVTDGCGVRLSLFVAPRVMVTGAQAVASDGSWGPLTLRQVREALSPKAARKPEDETEESTLAPSQWLGDAVDFSISGDSDFVIRVHRRDWRVDPNASCLRREEEDGWNGTLNMGSANINQAIFAPAGPAFWSVVATMPPNPPAFQRCSDRELVLYELHLGSFTSEGTLKAAVAKLPHLRDIGITAISLMPVQQDVRRMMSGQLDRWGYDVISFAAVDAAYGSIRDLAEFVQQAHQLDIAVIVDFVFNHMMWGAQFLYGPHLFLKEDTTWGPRPDFSKPEVNRCILAAAETLLLRVGVDGLRVDSTKSIRKLPGGESDPNGAALLAEMASLCRRSGRIAIAEDLEDGDGFLQWGGLGFHFQWDMALFCWIYDALVHPLDEFRDTTKVVTGLVGLAPGRGHALRGRIVFMESHDTAASDRYGRVPAAVHNGRAFMVEGEGEGGDAFQQAAGSLPYPDPEEVESNEFAARRAALGLVLVLTCPGVPMLLQGQEVGDCTPYCWPNGPAMDWAKVSEPSGVPAQWKQLCKDLIALRAGRGNQSAPGPLQGDGIHIFYDKDGVLAFLRWHEAEDSRERRSQSVRLALVVVNFRNYNFGQRSFGVPPSRIWRLAASSPRLDDLPQDVQANQRCPADGFPCSVDVPLEAYSAVVLLQES
mmetsp:Transcript_40328/g.93494  ORF Transcript_40328/g.93494 Transcript_40328/m.93494 type:complete len:806 (+) Transcript_40328:84-2501(+)